VECDELRRRVEGGVRFCTTADARLIKLLLLACDGVIGDLLLDETSWPGSLHAHAGTGCGGVCQILWLSKDLAIME